jgi:hypothetical protein
MAKRTFKFYRKNEADIMKSLGLKPTKNSGSTWIEKEDGQNDYVICQLKSTDAQSIKINQKDIRVLEENALVAHKLPVFAIQFLNTNEVWLMVKPIDISEIAKFVETGKCVTPKPIIQNSDSETKRDIAKIKSNADARNAFHDERNKKYEKRKKAW